MFTKIHHLGIGVRNLSESIRFYRDIAGLKLEKEIDWSSEGLKAALFPVGGVILELIEAVDPKGEIAQSLADATKLKDGIIHHLSYTVEDIEEEVKNLVSKGVKMINEKQPEQSQGGKVAWIDKNVIEGCMIELVENNYEIT